MSVLRKPRVRTLAQLSVAAVVSVVAVGLGAGLFMRLATKPAVEPLWPTPDPPWRQAADSALAQRIAKFDAGLAMKSVWQCDRAACGFEGRFVVIAPKTPADHDVRNAVTLNALMGVLAPPFAGEIAWPALADGQAQAMRLTQGYAYVVVQSDRTGPAGGGPVAGDVLDRTVRKVYADAGMAAGPVRPLDRASPGAAPAPPKPPAPAMALPDEPPRDSSRPSWR